MYDQPFKFSIKYSQTSTFKIRWCGRYLCMQLIL